ncbi:MAG TPA: KilA-N domain-containing protein [Bacteroidetes bacterium]|nr:KilA-N domain-containing protein [Bacteroidota bacterium]
MSKISKIQVEDKLISILKKDEQDYICLTDMLKAKDGSFFITDWLRNRNTLEFLSVWEKINNPNFNYGEFAIIRNKSGLNSFKVSVKEWTEKTNAIGIFSKAGRYGGTYAHKDIAFEFGTWISPTFKLYLITEYQRLKEVETNQYNLEWNFKRIISKANYHIHTDAVKNYILPKKNYDKNKEWLIYSDEADLLNVTLFGCTAKDWRDANPKYAKQGMNIRDIASINELAVLSNLESMNAELIKNGIEKEKRYLKLKEISDYQLTILNEKDFMKALKKLNDKVYIENKSNNK